MFQTRPGTAKGASRRQKRCQRRKRKARLASSRSCGNGAQRLIEAERLFQAWLVKDREDRCELGTQARGPGKRFMKNTTVNDI